VDEEGTSPAGGGAGAAPAAGAATAVDAVCVGRSNTEGPTRGCIPPMMHWRA
jgi:hypothetical protein